MSDAGVWAVIAGLGAVTYAIRLSFLGFASGRALGPMTARVLRYVPSAVIPALVAPMVAWDRATGGLAAPSLWLAALATAAVGAASGRLVLSLATGMATLHLARALGL